MRTTARDGAGDRRAICCPRPTKIFPRSSASAWCSARSLTKLGARSCGSTTAMCPSIATSSLHCIVESKASRYRLVEPARSVGPPGGDGTALGQRAHDAGYKRCDVRLGLAIYVAERGDLPNHLPSRRVRSRAGETVSLIQAIACGPSRSAFFDVATDFGAMSCL